MRIALAQINTTVGDLSGNAAAILRMAKQAASERADLVVFSELSLLGYPPQDLLERPSFLRQAAAVLQQLAVDAAPLGLPLVVGTAEAADSRTTGKGVWNTAVILAGGKVAFRQRKMLLPNYDVFDEMRYFRPAERQQVTQLGDLPVALAICEDGWNDSAYWEQRLYQRDPVEEMAQAGAKLLVSINASPYHAGKRTQRREIFAATARRHRTPLVYVNQVGANDQLVFDGSSFAMNEKGEVIASCKSFGEDLVVVDVAQGVGPQHANFSDENEAMYEALVLGVRDYFGKCGFQKALLGISGGIDSSLVACIAVEAIGKENVRGIAMPGPYSTDHSVTDAVEMAQRLQIPHEIISINAPYQTMVQTLAPAFAGAAPDVTEENLQSRLRGLTLMALSNKTGALVLTTGNKSETAVGYATLYGDMCGGLAVISDVYKTQVYELCRVANRRLGNAIPENVFVKPPSAELRPDQKDSDSLPPYDVLDAVLQAYLEAHLSPPEIAARLEQPIALVRDVVRKVERNEYKRQQAAPGLKVTPKAFGLGRRYPIVQRFRDE